MTKYQKRWLWLCFFIIFLLTLGMAFLNHTRHATLRERLDLNGIFENVPGVEIRTTQSSFFSDKPYQRIVICIPSLASANDDLSRHNVSGKNVDLVNKVIDREQLDKGFATWLRQIFDKNEAAQYTNHIEVWYRDDKIIEQDY
ncbi:hypothetical protein [Streptococcus respiraculi]|uniref:hypothetical protein n=1 Tax=Streptococcus respiraculi TaxID=2021971 RepID=UPI000E768370|nr:hypothetical protein [Streptococcus respiraculi]